MKPEEAILKLEESRTKLVDTRAANKEEETKKQDILKIIDNRISACNQEIKLEEDLERNRYDLTRTQNQIDNLEKIVSHHEYVKSVLVKKYGKSPIKISELSTRDQYAYLEAVKTKDTALAQLPSLLRRRIGLLKQRAGIKGQLKDLSASVSVGGVLPATPTDGICIPCIAQSVDDFSAKQRRQEGGKKVWPGKQSYNNCGVQSSEQIIHAVTWKALNEKDLLSESLEKGYADDKDRFYNIFNHNIDSGGTSPESRKEILEEHGVESDILETTKENIAKSIKSNKGIIINVHTGTFWNDSEYNEGGHAVMIDDGDFDKDGNLTHVYLNDTGTGQQGVRMEISELMKAADDRDKFGLDPSKLNVTKYPVW